MRDQASIAAGPVQREHPDDHGGKRHEVEHDDLFLGRAGARRRSARPAPRTIVSTTAATEPTVSRARRRGSSPSARRQMSLVTRANTAAVSAATKARDSRSRPPGPVGPQHAEEEAQVAGDDPATKPSQDRRRYRIAEFLEPPGDRAAATLARRRGPDHGCRSWVRIEVCPVGVPNQRRDQPTSASAAPGHADGAERGQRQHSDTVGRARAPPPGRRAVCNGRSVAQTVRCHRSSISRRRAAEMSWKIRWPVDKSIETNRTTQRTPGNRAPSAR